MQGRPKPRSRLSGLSSLTLPPTSAWGSAHLGQLLLQPAMLATQRVELLPQLVPGLFSGVQGALQALPLHLLLQPQLLQPPLLLQS